MATLRSLYGVDSSTGRKKYQRPQAILFSENSGYISDGNIIPVGYEIGTDEETVVDESSPLNSFLILSDDNRKTLDFGSIRIEKRERMINGRMRSYHIADKVTLSVSWDMLPSRSFSLFPDFNAISGRSANVSSGKPGSEDTSYTTDGGAGGVEILDWYNQHKGSFWVFLAYDNYKNFGDSESAYSKLGTYNDVVEMFITDFSYSVVKRGGSNHDLWNISISLEEV
jgi:hypothetical protein